MNTIASDSQNRTKPSIATEGTVPASVTPRYRFLNDNDEHLHTLDGRQLYGTSTVVGIISKELTWWASGMALAPLGFLNKRKGHKIAERVSAASMAKCRIASMPAREYADFLDECYRAHNTKKETTAVAGTNMHLHLEEYVNESIYRNAGEPLDLIPADTREVAIFSEWACANVREFLWSEAHCYSERLWTGGISDVGAILRDGTFAIIDFKSAKEAYYGYFVQMGGYATAIIENGLLTADGATVHSGWNLQAPNRFGAFIVFPFGAADVKPDIRTSTAAFERNFESAVDLYVGKSREFPDRGY